MARPHVLLGAPTDATKLALARRFRRRPTPAEAAAWRLLRNRRMLGLKFRRQQLIAGFVVDFYCAELRLVVELDGGVHEDAAHAEYDAMRTRVLSTMSIDVVRVPNARVCGPVLRDLLLPLVERRDRHALEGSPPPCSESPRGR